MIGLAAALGAVALACAVYALVCLRHRSYNRKIAFDDFLFSQTAAPFCRLRYGFFRASYNGCGVVAAVNASRVLGHPVHPADVISEFERYGANLFGLLGTNSFALRHYFRKRGYYVTLCLQQKQMQSLAAAAPVSVLWYLHRRGAHFVTLVPQEEGFAVYNAGRRTAPMPISSVQDFLQHRAVFALLMTISPDAPRREKAI